MSSHETKSGTLGLPQRMSSVASMALESASETLTESALDIRQAAISLKRRHGGPELYEGDVPEEEKAGSEIAPATECATPRKKSAP